MNEDFPYKSLHDYLDMIFRDKTPTENEIDQAKKQYWKEYNTHLKRNQRKKRKEITVSLDKQQWELLQQRLFSNQSPSHFIKEFLLDHLENKKKEIGKTNQDEVIQIEQQLFSLINYVESLLYQRRMIEGQSIGQLEKRLSQLQKLLEEKF